MAKRPQSLLVAIFVAGLVFHLMAALLAYAAQTITNDDLKTLVGVVLSIYSVHLAVICGGIFAKGKARRPPATGHSLRAAFGLSAVLSLLWNLVLSTRTAMFLVAVYVPTRDDSVRALISYLQDVAAGGSFLVVGALAFFFTRPED